MTEFAAGCTCYVKNAWWKVGFVRQWGSSVSQTPEPPLPARRESWSGPRRCCPASARRRMRWLCRVSSWTWIMIFRYRTQRRSSNSLPLLCLYVVLRSKGLFTGVFRINVYSVENLVRLKWETYSRCDVFLLFSCPGVGSFWIDGIQANIVDSHETRMLVKQRWMHGPALVRETDLGRNRMKRRPRSR